jgi:hypothetical protein
MEDLVLAFVTLAASVCFWAILHREEWTYWSSSYRWPRCRLSDILRTSEDAVSGVGCMLRRLSGHLPFRYSTSLVQFPTSEEWGVPLGLKRELLPSGLHAYLLSALSGLVATSAVRSAPRDEPG